MTLTYYDSLNNVLGPLPLSAADIALVRTVGVTITSADRGSQPLTLTTRVLLRNM
jgi:hypothetical protein